MGTVHHLSPERSPDATVSCMLAEYERESAQRASSPVYQIADLLPDADSKANVKQPRPRVSVLAYSSDAAAPVK